jgi:UDP-N-acetyl-D-mannosaminuronate dehydrogenase
VIDLVRRAVGGDLTGKRITALGLAFKPDVDDVRESPAVEVVRLLGEAGAQVLAFEPFKPQVELDGVAVAPTFEEAVRNAEVLLLLVNHSQFRSLTPSAVAEQTPARTVVDAVGSWDARLWNDAGFEVFCLGKC